MTTGTDVVANERSGKDILDENLWPGFDKFKVVQVRFAPVSYTHLTLPTILLV